MIIMSGRGHQGFWRLHEDDWTQDEVETVNRTLIDLLGGDRSTYNADRVMRLPGTVNSKTGTMAALVRFDEKLVYGRADFPCKGAVLKSKPKGVEASAAAYKPVEDPLEFLLGELSSESDAKRLAALGGDRRRRLQGRSTGPLG